MTDLQPNNVVPDDALIRLDEVLKRIPVSRSTFYSGMQRGLYPRPVSIGPRARAYRFSEIKAWLADPAGWQRDNACSKEEVNVRD